MLGCLWSNKGDVKNKTRQEHLMLLMTDSSDWWKVDTNGTRWEDVVVVR